MSRRRSATRRDYANDRAWLLEFIEAAPRELDGLGTSWLEEPDQFAAGFDVPAICAAATAFLAAADVRMERGSAAGRASVGAMVNEYRRTLAATPMAARLAEIADAAVKRARSGQGQNGADQRKANTAAEAERVRDIIEQAERKPGRPDLFKDPAAVLKAVRDRLNKPRRDRNTLAGYRQHVDSTMKIDGSPDPD